MTKYNSKQVTDVKKISASVQQKAEREKLKFQGEKIEKIPSFCTEIETENLNDKKTKS